MFAVWLPMLPGDSRDTIDPRILDDPRVQTYWDPNRITGDWFADNPTGGLETGGYTVWDAYYAFDRDARWTTTDPPEAVAAGATIIGNTSALEQRFLPLLR